MGFYLQPGESASEAVERIVSELLGGAQQHLTEPQTDPDVAVHEVRKSMKKLRALLRLLRPVIKVKQFRKADRAVRDFASRLGGARDSAVMLATFDQLVAHFSPFLNEAACAPIREALSIRYQLAMEQHLSNIDYHSLGAELHKLARLFKKLDYGQFSKTALLDSVFKTYRQGRGELVALHADPGTEQGHALRKQVKYLWYQLRLLSQTKDMHLGQLVEDLDRLGELLGQDHDLAVLSDNLQKQPEISSNAIWYELVRGLIETRRFALLSAALRLADRVYAEKPKRFLSGLSKVAVNNP